MSITANDMQAFLSESVSDTDPAQNGGRPANAPMPLSSKNNAYPDVNSRQREQGARRWRKIFLANTNSANLIGEAVMVLMDAPTAYGDYAYFIPGDFEGYESDLTGNAPMYGAAKLLVDATTGSSSVRVVLEDAALAPMLEVGREIVISTRASFENVSSTMGVEEIHIIQAVTANGADVTITTAAELEHDFAVVDGARVSVVYRPPDQRALVSDWSASGDSPVEVGNRGTIRQQWTIRMSAASFTLAGDTIGPLGSFDIADVCAPVNPAAWSAGAPYFRIPANALSGYASGLEITFSTTPAMTPIWINNVIPAGTREYGLTEVPIVWQLESPA